MTKTIYNYDPITGAYISEAYADESPLERGVFLVPAFATDVPPPTKEHSWRDGKWVLVPVPAPDPVVVLAAAKANALDRIASFAKAKRATIAGTTDDASSRARPPTARKPPSKPKSRRGVSRARRWQSSRKRSSRTRASSPKPWG
jgi:hypothetical protein